MYRLFRYGSLRTRDHAAHRNADDRDPGLTRLGFLVTLAILAGIGFAGNKVIPIYWNYLSMQDPVKEAAMAAARPGREAQVRAELIARAKRLGVDLAETRSSSARREPGHGPRGVGGSAGSGRLPPHLRFRVEKWALAP